MSNGWLRVRGLGPTAAVVAVTCMASTFGAQAQVDNVCDDFGDAPDVIVGDLMSVARWGSIDNVTSFSVGTTSCNLGTCGLNWSSGTPEHPVIAQNLFRLANGRFEQLGQSWLKHGFLALSLDLCATPENPCLPTSGDQLGVNCSDPYSSGLNGNQAGLGPKFEVNPATGEFAFPPTDWNLTGDVLYKRIQVNDMDLDPISNPGARYFIEGHYVTRDDAEAGNHNNNASYREVLVTVDGGGFNLALTGSTVRELPAISAWAALEPDVLSKNVDVFADGRLIVASKATDLGGGIWRYEYAIHNLNSHRGAGSFSVPIPAGSAPTNVGFHDVDYHSGEPFDDTDWTALLEPTSISWSTNSYSVDPDANALRWGTLYNFRFDIDAEPMDGNASIGLFRPGGVGEVGALVRVPQACDLDGICDSGEDCDSCALDCKNQGGLGGCCGDGTCDPGETSCSCVRDCGPCVIPCTDHPECDDGIFCNGLEQCVDDVCAAASDPCPGQLCDEFGEVCFDCAFDVHCNDGQFCNGAEVCILNSCFPGTEPCPGETCDDGLFACTGCAGEGTPCNDHLYCNGEEMCDGDTCVPGTDPCPGAFCDEVQEICIECFTHEDCIDLVYCNGAERCEQNQCVTISEQCPGLACDEEARVCLGNVSPQPLMGEPLRSLSPEQTARFEAGRAAFETVWTAGGGLGPVYNAASCSSCHATPSMGGTGPVSVTHFGNYDEVSGTFDPMEASGGAVLQAQAVSPECAETLPGGANTVAEHLAPMSYGLGFVEVIWDLTLHANASNPPAGLSGVAREVLAYEDPGQSRVGRFGWKSQHATLLSMAAEASLDHLGVTSRLLPVDHAPNGDPGLLVQCDAVADPEDDSGGAGLDAIDRLADYLRYLAPPPQTPRSGMIGAAYFSVAGCDSCHIAAFTTPNSSDIEYPLRDRQIRPYSDFLLHDMGEAADGIGQDGADRLEVRTAPLWGLRFRDRLWHDGRFTGSFESRVGAAIEAHGVPGSEALVSKQSFDSLPSSLQSRVVDFLGSLGQAEFDHDGDHDVDEADYAAFQACFTGPGKFYGAEDECALSDVDQDGDVDQDDRHVFIAVGQGDAGEVPLLELSPAATAGLYQLSWSESCRAADVDYAVYEGPLGDFAAHLPLTCSTFGFTSTTVQPGNGDRYFLVVPSNGFREGSYGMDSGGGTRSSSAGACLPQSVGVCDP